LPNIALNVLTLIYQQKTVCWRTITRYANVA